MPGSIIENVRGGEMWRNRTVCDRPTSIISIVSAYAITGQTEVEPAIRHAAPEFLD